MRFSSRSLVLPCPREFSIESRYKLTESNERVREKELPIAPAHRLIKKAGAERVSEEAAEALRDILEEVGVKIAQEALDLAKHAGRKTIKARDIEFAAKRLRLAK